MFTVLSLQDDSLKLTIKRPTNKSVRIEEVALSDSDVPDVVNGSSPSLRARKRTYAETSDYMFVDPDTHVPVVNLEDGTRLEGEDAPRQFELEDWLNEHPQFSVAQASEPASKRSRKPRFDPVKANADSLTGQENVAVINRETGRRITGSKAPILRQLTSWLEQNPAFDVDPKWRSILSLPQWKLPKHLDKRVAEKSNESVNGSGVNRMYMSGYSPLAINNLFSPVGVVQYTSVVTDRTKTDRTIRKSKS